MPPRARHHDCNARSGFEIQTIERIMFAASRLEPSIPHILRTARRS
jgi:hypothetical protein